MKASTGLRYWVGNDSRVTNERILGIAIIAPLVLGLGLQWNSEGRKAEEFEGQKFTLRDEKGNLRARLSLGPSNTVLFDFFGSVGQPAAFLAISEDGSAHLSVKGEDQRVRASFGMDRTRGEPFLQLFDRDAKPKLIMKVDRDGLPELGFYDGSGRRRAALGLREDGMPFSEFPYGD